MLPVLKWARVFRHNERDVALYSAVAKEELEDDFGADQVYLQGGSRSVRYDRFNT